MMQYYATKSKSMKTIDEIIDIMHSPESSESAVLWAGSRFDALSKEEVQNLYQRGKISLEELERHPAFDTLQHSTTE